MSSIHDEFSLDKYGKLYEDLTETEKVFIQEQVEVWVKENKIENWEK